MIESNDLQFIDAVASAARSAGISQRALAKKLGVSQGHLSKVLRAEVPLSKGMKLIIEAYLAQNSPYCGENETAWINAVKEAANRSEDFRRGVNAMIMLMYNASI